MVLTEPTGMDVAVVADDAPEGRALMAGRERIG